MTAPAIIEICGIRHRVTPAIEPRPVFVADMPGTSSDASATPHSGPGVVIAWLDPEEVGMVRLAWIKRPDGSLFAVRCSALRSPANVAARRIMPPRPQRLRSAG
jgi:hypothetical protein